ncbi:MAG: hypothetical protein IKJ36_04895 [Clostridia bacterium]|nr:hypothetical protein [Clostridia bacterium]
MLHLIPIPILLIAHLIYVVADKYKLNITKKICRIVMILSTIVFIYTFALYKGIDLIALVINFFKF